MKSAIDAKIKESLSTLELVQHAYASTVEDEQLSNADAASVLLSLNQIIRTAESIRESVPAFTNHQHDSNGDDASTAFVHPSVVSLNETKESCNVGVAENTPNSQSRPSSSIKSSDPTQPLLSIPNVIPADTAGKEVC